jgi:molybdopterin-guanine dinucleotide biosynthesis protein
MTASSPVPAEHPSEARLPVTVVTGFLGSGKTTLVKHILTNQQGLRTAVIVNEFSDIGIDGDLIVSAEDDMVELENGCICCSINGTFVDAIFRILDRGRKVDYLVVETTGLADPLPVVLTFLRSEFRDSIRLDSIITVADAASLCLDLYESQAAHNQLRYGDVVLLNNAISSAPSVCKPSRERSGWSRRERASSARRSAGLRSRSSSASVCSSPIAFSASFTPVIVGNGQLPTITDRGMATIT